MPRARYALLTAALTLLTARTGGAQASVYATASQSLACTGQIPPSNPSGTPTSLAVSISYTGVEGCSNQASAYSYLGVIGARARAAYTGAYFGSGGMQSYANSAWNDGINSTWDERFSVLGVSTFRLFFNVSATGGVSGNASSQAYPIAGIGYNFQFGNQVFSGTQNLDPSVIGNWGTISGSTDISAQDLGGGRYLMGGIYLMMSSYADARIGKNYDPGSSQQNASSTAEFGSTLVWKGVTGVEAYDAAGNRVALPSDFRLKLLSQQGEGDYWDSQAPSTAQPPSTVAPEPATFALMGFGLLGLLAARRRRSA